MEEGQIAIHTTRGIQQQLFGLLPDSTHSQPTEPKGVVYTKRWVVELILDLAGYTSDWNLVDALAVEPAAGNGAFLGPMVSRLADSCQRMGRPISDCVGSLIAYELDNASAKHALDICVTALTHHGIALPIAANLAKNWIRLGDYLADSIDLEAEFVVGNPPYVRLEDIPEETALLYRNIYPTMRGRADLYIAFYEAALRQLKAGGVCAFICADRWMRNQYGAELRELVTSGYSVDVIVEMHHANAFHDEVDAYPAITVLRKGRQGKAVIAKIGCEAESLQPEELAAALRSNDENEVVSGLRTASVDNWFKGADPWPCQSPEQLCLLRRLEERFAPLENSAKVGIGVATGNDSVFVTGDSCLVEPSRLIKLALAKDVRSGTMEWSGHYLIDPWNSEGPVCLEDYPRLQAYFEKHAGALKKRHTALKNARLWYRTIDRVHHLLIAKHKLYIPDIKNTLEPVLDRGETYPHHNLYFIESDSWDLEVLGGLLMSVVGHFFIASYGIRMRGGYYRFQAQYLRRIRLPHPETLSTLDKDRLKQAFRKRDRELASRTAMDVYGIEEREMEAAIGY